MTMSKMETDGSNQIQVCVYYFI